MKDIFLSGYVTRNKASYVTEAIIQGAKKCGYCVKLAGKIDSEFNNKKIREKDILIIWNRHSGQDLLAAKFEDMGSKVLSIENPYIPITGEKYISVGLSYHNDMKYAPKCLDTGERFNSFNREIKPWKLNGEDIVVVTQAKIFDGYGLGADYIKQPALWDSETIETLKRKTKKNIIFRQHPNGKRIHIKDAYYNKLLKNIKISSPNESNIPLMEDLENAHSIVTWNSNSATESLLNGVPVFYCAANIISAGCCNKGLYNINSTDILSDMRIEVFNRIAWSQYSMNEIAKGLFFDNTL